jgi:hypothetical protein
VEDAKRMSDALGEILRKAASAYPEAKKDIHKLSSRGIEFERAYFLGSNAAEALRKECNDDSEAKLYDLYRPWNEAYFTNIAKIIDDILKDWRPQ